MGQRSEARYEVKSSKGSSVRMHQVRRSLQSGIGSASMSVVVTQSSEAGPCYEGALECREFAS
jgi:hypothetical protein